MAVIFWEEFFVKYIGRKTENSRGVRDYWVVKLDSVGKIQWDKTIGGNKDDGLSRLKKSNKQV